jgi:hypothetical protein
VESVKFKIKKGDQREPIPPKATGGDLENTADAKFTTVIVD